MTPTNALDELDRKANEVFAGKVVRKDLVRRVKVGANVPVYVLEYLLGKYCASDDPEAVEVGLRVVSETLAENFVRPDEAQRVQAKLKRDGQARLIDKAKVRLVESEDKYWAELTNFGNKYVHVPEDVVYQYERLLQGGIWAQVDLRYDADEEVGGLKRPFFITKLRPIQVASFDFDEYATGRGRFRTEEWTDLLVRSMGLEPTHFSRRLKWADSSPSERTSRSTHSSVVSPARAEAYSSKSKLATWMGRSLLMKKGRFCPPTSSSAA